MSSFKGLYSLCNVSSMYNIDIDALREGVGTKFTNNIDVKKFGDTWLITEEALLREFGFIPLFDHDTHEGRGFL
jgi:hypothetical protein